MWVWVGILFVDRFSYRCRMCVCVAQCCHSTPHQVTDSLIFGWEAYISSESCALRSFGDGSVENSLALFTDLDLLDQMQDMMKSIPFLASSSSFLLTAISLCPETQSKVTRLPSAMYSSLLWWHYITSSEVRVTGF